MELARLKKLTFITLSIILVVFAMDCWTHEAKDFDDSILYKIEFDVPDFEKNPELKANVKTFFTREKEQYDCVIPVLEDAKEEKKTGNVEISPLTLIGPIFSATSCSYRIEAYWTYEICHGYHIRQYHEEREGKNIKFQEYYLGKWSDEKTDQLNKAYDENRKAGIKHKTTKIDNVKYPYFEMEMSDGTVCDIIGEPRTTKIRYVCYPHGKNEIYSFKETSSCNYEAIILTSLLCMDPSFHPEETKEVSIKCFSPQTETHKPLSMLRQELNELQMSDADLPIPKDATPSVIVKPIEAGDAFSLNQYVEEWKLREMNEDSTTPIKKLLSGSSCLTGGTGWWKYEFCHRQHVRQFHKDKKIDAEIYLGYFKTEAHRKWIITNPDKAFKPGSTSIWHHYEGGTRCDRTGRPREVDVKLTCTPTASTSTADSMYLLEPKTCQYILVVESPAICDIMDTTDEYGFINLQQYNEDTLGVPKFPKKNDKEPLDKNSADKKRNPTGATGTVSEIIEQDIQG